MVERGEVEPRGAAATTRPKKHMRQSRRPPARAVATGLAKKTCGGGAYEVTPRRPIRPQHRLVGAGGLSGRNGLIRRGPYFVASSALGSGERRGHRVTQSPRGRPAPRREERLLQLRTVGGVGAGQVEPAGAFEAPRKPDVRRLRSQVDRGRRVLLHRRHRRGAARNRRGPPAGARRQKICCGT